MKPKFLLILAASAFLFSCKKEKNDDGTTGNLLISTTTGDNINNYGFTYNYNSTNKLTELIYHSKWNGTTGTYKMNITRNSENIIQAIQFTGKDPKTGVENLNYKVNYDATVARYKSAIGTFLYNGATETDSVAIEYNSSGQIIKQEVFRLSGGNYFKLRKQEYMYDDNRNLYHSKSYLYDAGTDTYNVWEEYAYEYDNKTNPVYLGTEAVIYGYQELASVNNVARSVYTNYANSSKNITLSIAYTYNAANKPLTAAVTFPNTAILKTIYKYK